MRTATAPATSTSAPPRASGPWITWLIALLALAGAIALRVAALGRGGLWLDEIFSVSLSNLSLAGTLLAVLHFDVHPPLYYLQLNLWQRLGHSDFWLLLNSVCWSIGTLCAVFLGCRSRFNDRVALLALCLCAVMGSEIFFADELRMYSMLGCLTVLCWVAANRLRQDYRLRNAIPLLVLLALMAAVHSAALIPASAIMLYILPPFSRASFRRLLPTWIAVAVIVAVAFAPWILLAHMRHVEHAASPTIAVVAQTVGGWLLGYGSAPLPGWAAPVAALGVSIAMIAAAWTAPEIARLVICCVIWPLLFGALLCWIVQPIWLDRTFAFCAPFVAIAAAAALASRATRRETLAPAVAALVLLWVVGFAWLGYCQVLRPYKPDHYRDAAAYLRDHSAAGDAIFAPDDPDFWAIARYLIGPDWGSVLVVEDQSDKDRKFRLLNFLESHMHLTRDRLQALGLASRTRSVESAGRTLYIGNSPLPGDARIDTVWLVTRMGNEPEGLPLCTEQRPPPLMFGRVEIFRLSCDAPAR